MERKFKDNDIVLAGSLNLRMMVVGAVECVAFWRYKLAFTKKDGTIDKRRNYRFFHEGAITISK